MGFERHLSKSEIMGCLNLPRAQLSPAINNIQYLSVTTDAFKKAKCLKKRLARDIHTFNTDTERKRNKQANRQSDTH